MLCPLFLYRTYYDFFHSQFRFSVEYCIRTDNVRGVSFLNQQQQSCHTYPQSSKRPSTEHLLELDFYVVQPLRNFSLHRPNYMQEKLGAIVSLQSPVGSCAN